MVARYNQKSPILDGPILILIIYICCSKIGLGLDMAKSRYYKGINLAQTWNRCDTN